jgi:hypothetical protein
LDLISKGEVTFGSLGSKVLAISLSSDTKTGNLSWKTNLPIYNFTHKDEHFSSVAELLSVLDQRLQVFTVYTAKDDI